MTTVTRLGWRTDEILTMDAVTSDREYAARLSAAVYEWETERRDGTPVTLVWIVSTFGETFELYEIAD